MDQRRFTTFLLLMLAAWMLSTMLFPPPPPPQQADAPDAQQEPAEDPIAAEGMEPAAADDPDRAEDADRADEPDRAEEADQEVEPPVAADVPLEFVTLGSIDPAGNYPMLVTITNRGAGVQRVELASPRFRDLHDRSGYLGHIVYEEPAENGEADDDGEVAADATNVESGVVVQLVGTGSPAEKAGLKVGDRIVGVSAKKDIEITTVDDLDQALAETTAGQAIQLSIERGQADQELEVLLSRRPLEVIRPETENVRMRTTDKELPKVEASPSFLTSLHSINGKRLGEAERSKIDQQLRDAHWEIAERDADSVALRTVVPGYELEFLKRFTIKAVPDDQRENHAFPGYDIDLDIEIRNTGDAEQNLSYILSGPNGLPIEGWWYAHRISHSWSAAGVRDVVVRFQDAGAEQVRCSDIADDDTDPMGQGKSLAYASVDAQYFASAIIPQKDSLDEQWFDNTQAVRVGPKLDDNVPQTYTNVTFDLQRLTQAIDAGESLHDSYTIFAGPKRPELLKEYYVDGAESYNLSDLIYYGWFGSIAKGMLAVLHFFYGMVGNYGVAIVMLTVTVRMCMFPLSWKQTQSMARMQELKPELDKINEKYKNDMQKKQQAMQDLYAKHKINPLSGCLPLFIQLPIFMGLYRGLMIDVELRQSPLFSSAIQWGSNLAAPDMFYDWSWLMPSFINSGVGMFALGPYLNILPLVTVALFLASQQMFMPEPTSDQARMQQTMMKYMTLFMGLIFYKVASGLCLYFIVSSLWGILERKLLPKATPAGAATTAEGGSKPADGGDGSARTRDSQGSPPRNGSPKQKKRSKAKAKRKK